MYASEWSTRCGRGGTATKRGSCGFAAVVVLVVVVPPSNKKDITIRNQTKTNEKFSISLILQEVIVIPM